MPVAPVTQCHKTRWTSFAPPACCIACKATIQGGLSHECGESLLGSLPPNLRLALEMSLHEVDERRSMEGELQELEARWRDADAIARLQTTCWCLATSAAGSRGCARRAMSNPPQAMTTIEMAPAESILWRRLDAPGHDACTMTQTANGWLIHGTAAFSEAGAPVHLTYTVACNTRWETRRATIAGYIGTRAYSARIQHGANGQWRLNGIAQPHLADCDNVDLGFTAATNAIVIRHLALDIGAFATVRSAWLNVLDDEFSVLE